MKIIENKSFDEERALYGSENITVRGCRFEGEADGESALKESCGITAENCFFDLRYPFWHDDRVSIVGCEMTELCRAALWYSSGVEISASKLHGIKALRECSEIKMSGCDVSSAEFGWFCRGVEIENSSFEGEYFMLRSSDLHFKGVSLKGKYSFQYVENATFENCDFDTKDALWHAKNVTVKNSTVRGEYLAWYCENVTFENCKIIGTQPLCYCKGLRLIDCEMQGADLCFEKSEVDATLTSPVVSIKNTYSGRIVLPYASEIICDDAHASCEIIQTKK